MFADTKKWIQFLAFCLMCLFLSANRAAPENQDPLMQLFRASIQYSPQLKTFASQRNAIDKELQGLTFERWLKLNVDLMPSTTISNNQSNNAFQPTVLVSNTFDIANKKGFDIQIKQYERLKNAGAYQQELKLFFTQLSHHYYQWIYYQRLSELQKQNSDWFKQQIETVQKGVVKGAFAVIDLNRLEVTGLNQTVLYNQSLLEKQKLTQNILQLTGISDISVISDLSHSFAEVPFQSGHYQEQDFLSRSPELLQLELERSILLVNLAKESAAWFPDLILSDSHSVLAKLSNAGFIHQVQFKLSFQLLDGGRDLRIDARRERINALEQSYAQAQLVLQTEFRQQLLTLQNLNLNRAQLRQARDLALKNLDQIQKGYLKHFVDLTTLMNVNREWLQAESNLLKVEIDYAQQDQVLQHLSRGDIYL
jgi:outer membrane protein TolC